MFKSKALRQTSFILGFTALMLSFQNCSPHLNTPNSGDELNGDLNSDQPKSISNVTEALKPESQWALVEANSLGQKIELPKEFFTAISFIEIEHSKDLVCAGSCADRYQMSVRANCGVSKGFLSRGFSEDVGEIVSRVSLDTQADLNGCAFKDWNLWMIQVLTDPEISVEGINSDRLIIEKGNIELIFKKQGLAVEAI